MLQSAQEIIARASEARLFNTPAPRTAEATRIKGDARHWLAQADAAMSRVSAGEALGIVAGYYDIVHRIAYGQPADRAIINRHVLRAFEAYIHGDGSVDQYLLFKAISEALNKRRDPAYFGRPLQWYSRTLERWHSQFRYGESLDPLSEYDTIQRVNILLSEDLWAYETSNQAAYKQQLREAYLQS